MLAGLSLVRRLWLLVGEERKLSHVGKADSKVEKLFRAAFFRIRTESKAVEMMPE